MEAARIPRTRALVDSRICKIFDMKDPAEASMARSVLESIEATVSLDDDMSADIAMDMISEVEAVKACMSAPGTLGLPDLLERRRWEHGITDGAFRFQPAFDRVLIHQISQWKGDCAAPGSKIVMSPISRKKEHEANPEGVIVAAGLRAMDELVSNGMDLGHMVTFIRQAPWRKRVGFVRGVPVYAIILRTGDIMGSEDLSSMIRDGTMKIVHDEENNEHVYERSSGEVIRPSRVKPFMGDDY
jgi:hypothetical protein